MRPSQDHRQDRGLQTAQLLVCRVENQLQRSQARVVPLIPPFAWHPDGSRRCEKFEMSSRMGAFRLWMPIFWPPPMINRSRARV